MAGSFGICVPSRICRPANLAGKIARRAAHPKCPITAMIAIAALGPMFATYDGEPTHNRLWEFVGPSSQCPRCCINLTDSIAQYSLLRPLAGQNGVVVPLPAIDLE